MQLAFDRIGSGPPLIIVLGAFNTRSTGAPLAAALAPYFTVINYDRRGRGDSGDEPTYSVEAEIQDLAELSGPPPTLFGFSSGAALALRAARVIPVAKLILFDLPLGRQVAADHAARLDALVRSGRRGDAVEYFQRELVGIPAPVVEQMRHAPFRPALEAIAHTLVYDALVVGDGSLPERPACPTLAICGGKSPPFMRATTESFPDHLVIETLGHDLEPAVLVPPIRSFC